MRRILTYILPAIVVIGLFWTLALDRKTEAVVEGSRTSAVKIGSAGDVAVARVNGEPIMKSEFEAAVASLPERMRESMATPGGKRSLIEELIRLKVFEQEAEKRGIDKDPQVARALEMQRASVLANALMGRLVLERRGQQDLQRMYEQNKDRFATIHAWQIVIGYDGAQARPRSGESRDREAAMQRAAQLETRLRNGESFEAVARAESDDTRTAPNGGDLGILNRSSVPFDQIADPLFALEPGELSDPVDSPIGIHIFRVTEKQVRSFEEVQPMLKEQAGSLLTETIVKDLRASANVELDPDFFPSEKK